jgi:protein-L-isoaspartate(D-aspartate) O-methyltransferase
MLSVMFRGGNRSLVARAMAAVPRSEFVPGDLRAQAADDAALPIGWGQTISQPSLVAWMTRALQLGPGSRVLEIGTGSGYQAAILAEIAGEVFTIERVPELAAAARERLVRLGYTRIQFRVGDGALGWPEAAPFDGIVVTAAASALPPALMAQLGRGARLVAPVGAAEEQVLVLLEKRPDGRLRRRELCSVRFVPLVTPTLPFGNC